MDLRLSTPSCRCSTWSHWTSKWKARAKSKNFFKVLSFPLSNTPAGRTMQKEKSLQRPDKHRADHLIFWSEYTRTLQGINYLYQISCNNFNSRLGNHKNAISFLCTPKRTQPSHKWETLMMHKDAHPLNFSHWGSRNFQDEDNITNCSKTKESDFDKFSATRFITKTPLDLDGIASS